MTLEVSSHLEVDRTRPHAELDGTDIDGRLSRYREACMVNMVRTKHPLADEGSYFTVNNAQTGLATAAAPTAFSATNPFILVYNTCGPTDDFAMRAYLDYLTLVCTAIGTAAASVQFAITLDRGNRYSSGGTELTSQIRAPSQVTSLASTMRIYGGNITATAATANARTVVGNRYMKGAIPVVGDTYTTRFGTTDNPDMIGVSTIVFTMNNVPPILLGPDESALIHLWFPSQSAASSYVPEFSWWER